mmetsp:Transcript_13898/g.29785  ORF Transcript_13898/g.29785 Transcript_13898/m.29785 type:complete len:97 (-) Transcript_13898:118-408(-)
MRGIDVDLMVRDERGCRMSPIDDLPSDPSVRKEADQCNRMRCIKTKQKEANSLQPSSAWCLTIRFGLFQSRERVIHTGIAAMQMYQNKSCTNQKKR